MHCSTVRKTKAMGQICSYLGDGNEEMRKAAAGAVSALGENDYTNQVKSCSS